MEQVRGAKGKLDFSRYEDIVLTFTVTEILFKISYRNGHTYFFTLGRFFCTGQIN
jgi:hypothetical protein